MRRRSASPLVGRFLVAGILAAGFWHFLFSIFYFQAAAPKSVFAAGGSVVVTSTLVVTGGNTPPVVSGVTVNGASDVTLVINATTSVNVQATVTDDDGCADITGGTSTILLYRSGFSSSSCSTIGGGLGNNLSCYRGTAFTASSTCSGGVVNATTTFGVYYFADATDSSSSYASQNWMATVIFRDQNNGTGTADSAGGTSPDVLSLLGIAISTTSVNYGSITPGSSTLATTSIVTVINAGNTSTTLQANGTALVSGANSIATSSQHYATSTFTYGGAEQPLLDTATSVSGFTIPRPPLDARWVTTSKFARVRTHGAVVSNGYIYTMGGSDSASVTTSSVFFAPISATNSVSAWATTTPLPRGVQALSAVVSNGYIYTTGGIDDASVTTSTVFFAPISATNSVGAWATTTPLPRGIARLSTVVSNGYIYTVGGLDDASVRTSTVYFAQISATNSVGTWATTTPLPTGLSGHTALTYNGYLYTVGGCNGACVNPTSTVFFAPFSATNSVGTWATTTPMPTGTYLPTAVIDNGFIYVMGGCLNGLSCTTLTSTVNFAPISATNSVGSWAMTTPLPVGNGIWGHVAVVNNGFIYSTGGSAAVVTSSVFFASAASHNIYWGLQVPSGTASGNFTGTNTFTAVFSP